MAGISKYLVRRGLTLIPTVLGVLLITFFIGYVIPADPARAWAGGEKADPNTARELAKRYHLDEPFWSQFYWMVRGLLTNAIESPVRDKPIFDLIFYRLPTTVQLALFTEIIAVLFGIPMGIIAALKKDTWIDSSIRIWALVGTSLPVFWFGYLLIYVFYIRLPWTDLTGVPRPSSTITGLPVLDAIILGDWDVFFAIIKRFWLPSFMLGILFAGTIARYLRNTLLDFLQSETILFAKSKGLPPLWVWKHALKNSLIPVVTIIGFGFGSLLGGAVITETVFSLPGLGRLTIEAIYNLDFPVIIGTTLFFAIIVVLTSLIVDIIYSLIDPRVRL